MSNHQNCRVEPLAKPLDLNALRKAQAIYFAVSGIGCQTCATRVRNGLLKMDGVLLAEINLNQSIAAVAYDPQQTTTDLLKQAVINAGNDGRHHYSAEVIKTIPASDVLQRL